MEHFIIIVLSILVLIILALYIHKVIMYNHIQEEIRVVFNNLANINSFINSKLDIKEQSQSQKEILHNINMDNNIKVRNKPNGQEICTKCKHFSEVIIPCIDCIDDNLFESNDKIVESFEVEHDIKKDDNVMVNIITNKVVEDKENIEREINICCFNCIYDDLSERIEPCKSCKDYSNFKYN